jgi:hypothetical protein
MLGAFSSPHEALASCDRTVSQPVWIPRNREEIRGEEKTINQVTPNLLYTNLKYRIIALFFLIHPDLSKRYLALYSDVSFLQMPSLEPCQCSLALNNVKISF